MLITGASGFVARGLVPRLARERGIMLRLASRGAPADALLRQARDAGADVEAVPLGDLHGATRWETMLEGIDAVVHLAARVHQVTDRARDPLMAFRRVNAEATESLARAACDAGVRRFILLSTVKVHGESGAFTERDAPRPADAYARSKLEAEQALRAAATGSALECIVIRPPLVHGPGAKANLASLARAIARGVPLPLGGIEDNRRSLVGVDNLADLVARCLVHPAAHEGGGTYLVSDGEDVSTTDLARRLGAAMGRRARLLPVPRAALRALGRVTGRTGAIDRLL
jgi:nucleoside-diphosphate-sugar epimerase